MRGDGDPKGREFRMSEDRGGWGAIVMTTLASIAFFASLGFAYLSDDKQTLAILEGMGGGAFVAAVNFWIGSSAGSRRKDELLAASSPTTTTTTTPSATTTTTTPPDRPQEMPHAS